MRLRRFGWNLGLGLALAGNSLWAGDSIIPAAASHGSGPDCAIRVCPSPYAAPCPAPCPAPTPGPQPGKSEAVPPTPSQPAPFEPGAAPPTTDAFSQAPRGGTGETRSFNPNMLGDFLNPVVCGPVTVQRPNHSPETYVPGTTYPAGTVFNAPVSFPGFVLAPNQPLPSSLANQPIVGQLPPCAAGVTALVARGAFKITDNESPRPEDRVYTTYNFFDNVNSSFNSSGQRQTDVHREVIGVEKTFLNGNASIGLRLPFIQVRGESFVNHSDVGDLSIVFKYALINNAETGNVLSGGLVVTTPTGPSFLPHGVPDIHPTLLQPFVGAIYNMGDFYVHGFSSILVPTDSRDVTILFNDLGVGYFLYRTQDSERRITAVVPTIEMHVNTPLNHRGSMSQPLGLPDIVDLTFGTTVGLGQRSQLTAGLVTPVTGPKPFDVEAQVFFNFRF